MNPDLNGQSAVLAKTRPYLVLATDRHRCGQPLRALGEEGQHLLAETRHTRFVRFETREEAEAWLENMTPRLVSITSDYVYTIVTL